MAEFDLAIRGGMVVTAAGVRRADVAIRGEQIVAVAEDLDGTSERTVDATGLLVLPGAIDVHVHLQMPLGDDLVSSDDFETGTIAAACGGTTTIIDFTTQPRGVSLHEGVHARRGEADGRVAVDYSLHLQVTDASQQTLAELASLAQSGYPSLKLYMTYEDVRVDDAAMLLIMEAAARAGALVMVHAENHAIIQFLSARLLASSHTAPSGHPLSRPSYVEGEATERALALARAAGAPVYIVHLTSAEALAAVRRARAAGVAAYAETCPQYLLLSDEAYWRPGFEGAKYVISPPLRPQEHHDALWAGLADGTLSAVATDHCPWFLHGQKDRGKDSFTRIPGGIAGLETRLPLLYHYGVGSGRISLPRLVDLCATGPARLFGLTPHKGNIVPGADADIVLFDPQRRVTISQDVLHHRVDYTPYEGMVVTGWPVLTFLRGRVIAENGRFVGQPGQGRFIGRQRRQPL